MSAAATPTAAELAAEFALRKEDDPVSLRRERIAVHLPQLTLEAELALPFAARALLVLVASCASGDDDARLEAALQREGFATLRLDLLQSAECRYADAPNHLPLLTERLLALIAELHRQIALDAIPALPIGLIGGGQTTPLVVRVAAQRDRDVRALVCHGGLIDLAGRQYLKVLQAPLLLLAAAGDSAALANAERARPYLPGVCRVETLTETDAETYAARRAALTAAWFRCHLAA
ncbi:hypothetical protein [Azospira restricta]|uniref:Alpha/beta hydrolase n=1 Tax=Azospira restricta TaxID=404405 RepID=A0A974PX37_9RHOO|nr:hypothetical protein [Azospira restricta]QRJ62585.1 hypothetical protein IWH25_12460 [Azospira restricta]